MALRVEPFTDHDLTDFSCGVAELDRWLKEHAANAAGQGTRTYLLIDSDGEKVAGYFSIAPHIVERHEAPARIGRGAPAQIPAVLLAKLALTTGHQGRGIGAEFLIRCLETILEAARKAGGRLIVVDAISEHAAAFYRHHNFQPIPNNPNRLVMKLSTAAKALGKPWP